MTSNTKPTFDLQSMTSFNKNTIQTSTRSNFGFTETILPKIFDTSTQISTFGITNTSNSTKISINTENFSQNTQNTFTYSALNSSNQGILATTTISNTKISTQLVYVLSILDAIQFNNITNPVYTVFEMKNSLNLNNLIIFSNITLNLTKQVKSEDIFFNYISLLVIL